MKSCQVNLHVKLETTDACGTPVVDRVHIKIQIAGFLIMRHVLPQLGVCIIPTRVRASNPTMIRAIVFLHLTLVTGVANGILQVAVAVLRTATV